MPPFYSPPKRRDITTVRSVCRAAYVCVGMWLSVNSLAWEMPLCWFFLCHVVHVSPPVYDVYVDLIRMTGGADFIDNAAYNGGAIYNVADVDFADTAYFWRNSASEGFGGAIFNDIGEKGTTPGITTFVKTRVFFEENEAEVRGGSAIRMPYLFRYSAIWNRTAISSGRVTLLIALLPHPLAHSERVSFPNRPTEFFVTNISSHRRFEVSTIRRGGR